ncbi:glycine cleavage system aminomethyltransferase GcvT [Arthrobacter mobilis]|uniref:Aminomethyltransferase n=1 Tax=Arthrobacter mobilis TaxID=2724944 RepID=A0A7X6HDT2_9MICC|nr:glycine cleavage system aminomethyltransferase GcvT [Arthrobacter mobilis]NKX54111.1 glycine cleavage system aminomethyltransferase GcvT [Arthrobacter mobilis]
MSTGTTTGRYTALQEQHQKLGASFTDFGGWQMPLKYGSELAEHHAVRAAAGLFDLSHMGEVWVEGPEAAKFLDYALVGNLGAVAPGRAKYSLICNADGGIIDDLISYRRPATGKGDRYLVVPNAGNAATVAAELTARAAGFDVTVTDASAATSLVAVQGPAAQQILLKLIPAGHHRTVQELKYYAAEDVEFTFGSGAHKLLLARTGYTGEDGFEIYVPNESAAALWEALLAVGQESGLIPAGLACRDSLRLEAGMPLYGNELSLQVTPFEAGLGPVVSFKKESDFVGRSALEARKAEGPKRRLVGLRGLGRRAARSHYPVLKDGAVVGEVTSGQPSPTLGYPVALAYVDAGLAVPGTRLDADLRGKAEPFEVVELPFYKREK